jgi:hypothetical protein
MTENGEMGVGFRLGYAALYNEERPSICFNPVKCPLSFNGEMGLKVGRDICEIVLTGGMNGSSSRLAAISCTGGDQLISRGRTIQSPSQRDLSTSTESRTFGERRADHLISRHTSRSATYVSCVSSASIYADIYT